MKKMPAIEIFLDSQLNFRFRIKARNGKIIAQSEGYTKRSNCKKGVNALADVMWQYSMADIKIEEV